MKNIDKIRNLQPKQLADEIFNLIDGCAGLYDMCAYYRNGKCQHRNENRKPCKNGILDWLNKDDTERERSQ